MKDILGDYRDIKNKTDEKPEDIIGYSENTFKTIDELPFHAVDSLVISQLCYMNIDLAFPQAKDSFAGSIKDLYKAELFGPLTEDVRDPDSNIRLLKAVTASPRYRDIKLGYFEKYTDKERQEQFFAARFLLPGGEIYIAYRGTDNSIVGWKEDFNMLFTDSFPGGERAAGYLDRVAALTDNRLILGGHSKGGSLSVYRASFCDEKAAKRVTKVYNHDGPGLSVALKQRPGYRDISGIVHTILPQESMIGVIFNDCDYTAVKSDRVGVMQHDPFSWQIQKDKFVKAAEINKSSDRISEAAIQEMMRLPESEREMVINTVFSVIESVGEDNFTHWPRAVVKDPGKVYNAVKNLPRGAASKVLDTAGQIIKAAARSILPAQDGKIR